MKRAIVTPATVPTPAVAELKQWLGITTTHDDAPLAALLRIALDMCEAFTGQMPLETTCEEILPAGGGWLCLSTRPIQTITAVHALAADGARTALPSDGFELDLAADGGGRVRLRRSVSTSRVAVRFNAGIAADWSSLPPALRHGMLRLSAYQHREREGDRATLQPPAAVAALWRPWRRMRLA